MPSEPQSTWVRGRPINPVLAKTHIFTAVFFIFSSLNTLFKNAKDNIKKNM